MVGEADMKEPLETGGILAGYWASAHEVVISAASGPGPNSLHLGHRFKPDPGYQEAWISNRYAQTKGAETYLGDWHTHPRATVAIPSWTDRLTARRIANAPEARAPHPVILILTGTGASWKPSVWVARLVPVIGSWCRLRMEKGEVRPYVEPALCQK
jgi:integrative and conjugative element protein (TIGR02256 family)